MTKKWITLGLTLACTSLLLAGCQSPAKQESSQKETTTEKTTKKEPKKVVDLNALELPQLNQEVADNEALVEMETTEGNIKIKLFPEIAPKAVENFLTHAKKDYYKDVLFHRVINDFMIQTGDPEGTGMGGESIWKKPFKDEGSQQLFNIRGALSMANAGPNTNGSQFFIVQNKKDMSEGLLTDEYPEKIIQQYKQGGAPYLDYVFEGSDSVHTVFGQVIEGMDVVDKIAEAETDSQDKPKKDIKIEKITVLKDMNK
ncbi:peptidylprolyl isomerase [Vagococcus humatus]|uniref:Peptidyl-prolyl cis-trans isomerase n=1 Tax=Vagococcus humatus TaxID=1889241 RepID=A0A429Z8P7_9ENTE|nr:peptidylprolyl isomerase [Vagococcus humatus]RST90087.1 peptidylprolyl isomerase [Vagococcus humatus]